MKQRAWYAHQIQYHTQYLQQGKFHNIMSLDGRIVFSLQMVVVCDGWCGVDDWGGSGLLCLEQQEWSAILSFVFDC